MPLLRRCGCGLVKLTEVHAIDFGAYFTLPGEHQTVPPSELYCVVVLCYLLARDAVADIASAYELTVVGIARRQQGGDNYDLWALLWQVVEAKRLTIRARWVKAHGDEHPEYFSGMP